MLTKKKLSKRRVTTAVSSFLLLAFIIGCGSQEELSGDRNLIPDNNQTESHYNTANKSTNSNNKISSNAKDVSQLEETPVIPVGTSEWRRTNFRKLLADLDIEEISSGSVGRDGIPPIYNPLFISIQEAEAIEWLTGDHPVAIVELNGNVKAYPLGILTFHEVVNDTIGDTPIVLTYCPLCYTAIGFIREVNGTVLNFGTTGNLRRSNLIMWDDVTESWWQQITGQAIIGDLAGESLNTVSVISLRLVNTNDYIQKV